MLVERDFDRGYFNASRANLALLSPFNLWCRGRLYGQINYINLFHLCKCVSVFVGEGRGGMGGGELKRVILTSNTYDHCHILTHLTKFGDNCKVNLTTTGVCELC